MQFLTYFLQWCEGVVAINCLKNNYFLNFFTSIAKIFMNLKMEFNELGGNCLPSTPDYLNYEWADYILFQKWYSPLALHAVVTKDCLNWFYFKLLFLDGKLFSFYFSCIFIVYRVPAFSSKSRVQTIFTQKRRKRSSKIFACTIFWNNVRFVVHVFVFHNKSVSSLAHSTFLFVNEKAMNFLKTRQNIKLILQKGLETRK